MTCDKCSYKRECRHQCMNLPEGKTCVDCKNFKWCQMAYGVKAENTKCGFEPIRFRQKKALQDNHIS